MEFPINDSANCTSMWSDINNRSFPVHLFQTTSEYIHTYMFTYLLNCLTCNAGWNDIRPDIVSIDITKVATHCSNIGHGFTFL